MAILLITTPPAKDPKGRPPCLPSFPTGLHRSLKALHAVMSSGLAPHAHLAQTQGIIALYEFGQGMYEQAHQTLSSAFVVARLLDDELDIELKLTWQLCLMALDKMISLSTHSRVYNPGYRFREVKKLSFACPSTHILSKVTEAHLKYISDPRRHRPSSEPRVQKIKAMGEDVARAGRILQNVINTDRDNWESDFFDQESDDDENGDAVDKELLAMTTGTLTWLEHAPRGLSLSAFLVRDYDPSRATEWKPERPGAEAGRALCQGLALDYSKKIVALHKKKDFDLLQLSMIDMFCIMHNMAMMLKDPFYDYAHKGALALRPALKRYALRWPFAVDYANHISDYIKTEKDLYDRHRC